jgi:ABC-type glycerol-3-phosphate transport system substrate-binding protein
MRWLALLVLALALVAAGCGGSDDDSTAVDDTTTTVEETTTDETTSEDTTTDDGDGDSFNFADEDCQALVAAYVSVSSAFAQGASGSSDDLADQTEAFSEFADKVPEEIRADVQTIAAAYAQYIQAYQDSGIQPGQIPTAEQAQELQAALQSVGDADVTAASERLGAWTEENCTG